MSEFTSNLLEGIAAYLADAGVGAWDPAGGPYADTDTGIVLGSILPSPDRLVTLTDYPVSDAPFLSDSVIGVQVRCRWDGADRRGVSDLADVIFSLLHGRENLVLSTGATITQCLRKSAASLGQDENLRWMTTANYYCSVWRPSANRT